MPSCQVCQHANEEGAEYCEECGVKLGGSPAEHIPTIRDTEPTPVGPPGPEDAPAAQPAAAPPAPVACPGCSASLPAGSKFCTKCGTRLDGPAAAAPAPASGPRKCPACSADVEPSSAFCAQCGGRIDTAGTPAPPRSRADVIRLRVVAGKDKDRIFEIEKQEIKIGRHPDNDIPLENDGYVSGKHTRILRQGTDYFIEDLGSTNGTFVKVRQMTKVAPGDEVKIGQSIFRLEA